MVTIDDKPTKTLKQINLERLRRVCQELMEIYMDTGDDKVYDTLNDSLRIYFNTKNENDKKEMISPYEHLQTEDDSRPDGAWKLVPDPNIKPFRLEPFDGLFC